MENATVHKSSFRLRRHYQGLFLLIPPLVFALSLAILAVALAL